MIFLLFFLIQTAQAQIFVKADASGANDGTSWADAYTDLSDALANSLEGDQVWVAAGTYKPGGANPDSTSFYTFPHDLELYGGFAGTETMLSERDWATNETILSGDHNGDDVDDDFGMNRNDNSNHVMWLTDTVTTASTVDGFTIRNGETEPASDSGNARRGGGILAYGAPAIRNCYFTQNFGHFGGAMYPRGSADDIIIENCTFENNRASWGGAGIYNLGERAAITNCTFVGNEAVGVLGGGLYNGVDSVTVTDCAFNNNQASMSRGGGMYTSGHRTIITNCTFDGNGAAMSTGGGLQIRSGNDPGEPIIIVDVIGCTFQGNEANWGGAIGVYDRSSIANIMDCDIISNSANRQGGALIVGFGGTANFTNTLFRLNQASENAGAIWSQNDSTTVSLVNCTLSENGSVERGGAITIVSDNSDNFETTTPLPVMIIENTLFANNVTAEQGGAINLSNANLTVINSVFEYNFVTEDAGIGGAISLNTIDSLNSDPEFRFINNTFANNNAAIGAGISNWLQEPALGNSNAIFQNNIFYNPDGDNYIIEPGAGIPVATSIGGNLSTDNSAVDVFNSTNDLNETLPLFVDFGNDDYHLQNGSPCVDAGIAADAPLLDFDGQPRVDEVDMGAYENQKLVGVQDLENTFGLVTIFPNPIEDNLNFSFKSMINDELQVLVTDLDGKVVFSSSIEKSEKEVFRNYNVTRLAKGMYNLTITNGKYTNTVSFVKIK